MTRPIALYFGEGDGGHFLRGVDGWRTTLDPKRDVPGFPWSIERLDTGLLKNGKVPDLPDGRVHWTCGGAVDFWHAFFWWDRSGDKRPASNSGFYVRGFGPSERARENAPAAFEFAGNAWPDIVARQLFPLALVLDYDAAGPMGPAERREP